MRLPKHDPIFTPYAQRADNMLSSMKTDRWTPAEYPALAMLRTAVKALAAKSGKEETAALLLELADLLANAQRQQS